MLTADRPLAVIEPTAARPAPRPADAPLRKPTQGAARVFLYLAPACVVLPLTLFAFGREAGLFGELFGGLLALTMLLAAAISALVSRSVSRRLKRFRDGDYLAHWTYTEEEWREFVEADWERRRRDARQAPWAGLVLGGLIGFILRVPIDHTLVPGVGGALGALAGGAAVAFLGALLGWLGGWAVRAAGRRRYQRMRQTVGETYIGRDAAYCDGLYWSWSMPGVRPARLELAPGRPAVLVFTLRVNTGQSGYTTYQYRAPVPHGREGEARRVLHAIGGG